MRYVALSLGLLIIAATVASTKANSTGELAGLGVGLVLFSTIVSAFQAAENGSPVLSVSVVLGTTTGLFVGLVLPLPTNPNPDFVLDALVASILLGAFLGATGYLSGQQLGDLLDTRSVEPARETNLVMAAIVALSLGALVLALPL